MTKKRIRKAIYLFWPIILSYVTMSASVYASGYSFLNPKKDMRKVVFFSDYLKGEGEGVIYVRSSFFKSNINVEYYIKNNERVFCVPSDFFENIKKINVEDYLDESGGCVEFPSKKHRWAYEYNPVYRYLDIYIPDELLLSAADKISDSNYGDNVTFLKYNATFDKESGEDFDSDLLFKVGANLNGYKFRVKGDTKTDRKIIYAKVRGDLDDINSYVEAGYDYIYNDVVNDSFYGISLKNNGYFSSDIVSDSNGYITGFTSVDSNVNIYAGDELVKKTRVLAGTYKILKPNTSSGEDLRVELEGDDGSKDTRYVNSGMAVSRGNNYSVTTGLFKRTEKLFVNYEHSLMFDESKSIYFQGMYSEGYSNLKLSPRFNYNDFSFDFSHSHVLSEDGDYGVSRANFNLFNWEGYNGGVNWFAVLYSDNKSRGERERSNYYLAKKIGQMGSVRIDYTDEVIYKGKDKYKKSYGISYSNSSLFAGKVTFSAGVRFNSETDYYLSLTVPLGRGRAQSDVGYVDREARFRGSYFSNLGDGGVNAGVEFTEGDFNYGRSVGFYQNSDKVNYYARYNKNGSKYKYSAGGSGIIYLDGDDFYLNANEVNSGYIYVGGENKVVGGVKVGEDGYVINSVPSFSNKVIQINDDSVLYRSGSKKEIKLRDGELEFIYGGDDKYYNYVFIAVDYSGNPMEKGLSVYSVKGVKVSSVKSGGIVSFSSLNERERLIIGDDLCEIDDVSPVGIDSISSIISVKCSLKEAP
ncbi:hypothetical protein AB4238_20310 [Shewanella sp. 10N.286.45.A1]|uniref:hypothetical protein n=1 Tax=Shewanella sp. 10N.286.45.A1 TaxID=3229694 RepID=UPI0035511929